MEAEQSKASERINTAEKLHQAETEKLKVEKQRATVMAEERTVWEAIAEQQEQQLNQLKQQHEAANKTHAVEFTAQPAEVKAEAIKAIEKLPFEMNEAETRLLIDAQLRES
jgi:type I restriction enzyme R subunit